MFCFYIRAIQLRSTKWKKTNKDIKKILNKNLTKSCKDEKKILQYQSLLYVHKIIYLKPITCHNDDLLAWQFGIVNICNLMAVKYY